MERSLNWFGWSIDTIAAVYETDAAFEEASQGLTTHDYAWAAFRAELLQNELDKESTYDRF